MKMNILRTIQGLFSKEKSANSYTLSLDKDKKKRVQAEIILTAKESAEMSRKERLERYSEWLEKHKSLKETI
jgi:hypothetical protein